MHVACIGTGWFPEAPGGLERYVYGLVRTLADRGDVVDFYTTGHPRTVGGASYPHTIGNARAGIARRLITAASCYARELPRSCDVVNVHFALSGFPALPFIRSDVPLVYHFHGPWWQESELEGARSLNVLLKKRIEQIVYKRCSHFIAHSAAFKRMLCSSHRIPEDRVSVLASGIDTDAFVPSTSRRSVRAQLGWPQDRFIAFTARRLIRRVGLPALLGAAADVKARRSDLWLAIAGKGPLEISLQRQIDAMELNDHVRLLGFVSEEQLVMAYQAADVTIVPSESLEGFGSIIAESLACGTPVVATPVGGMPEWLEPLQPSLVMEGIDRAAIARSLEAVITGRLPLPSPERCRAYAEETFSWPVVAAGVRSVFHEHSQAKWTKSGMAAAHSG
jgi:glycosyltransferase involved in cell wall biosynthesis